ncbi:DUF1294 domain-containing protein [Microbulbifer sp. HZ11]|uniref:DUF1294 domain-containing protein n=1 Tax=unclassified Microbulbifer TaxID=2619833 RepID=UPI00068B5F89|nr:DUF1294 domain-containing protein [Microbulbifer sp. HZ11]
MKRRQRKSGGLPAGTSRALAIGGIFFGLITVFTLIGQLPPVIPLFYAGMSLLTYLVYYLDKSAARSGRRRTKENSLHLLSLLGGWPGALVAQQHLRHKTRKQPFRLIFWLTVTANLMALAWLHSGGNTGFLAGFPLFVYTSV